MGAIDDLVDANRLNVQLLAAIPAIVLLAVGSRFFFAGTPQWAPRGRLSAQHTTHTPQ